jgi:exopolyphosphatase/guanosine-5'-triphosphate,3'-diphosphate pyrophosphatase
VISAQEEARYAALSVRQAFDLTDKNVAIADIGGGSTEVVFASGGLIDGIFPTKLGAVRLAEQFGSDLFGGDYQQMVLAVDQELKEQIPKLPVIPQLLFGTGGTFTSLASMLSAERGTSDTDLTGFRVTRAAVKHLAERLQGMTLRQRRSVPGLSADRADIIVPGLAIIDRLMRRLKVNALRVHTGGVRDGLLWSMAQGGPTGAPPAADRKEALKRFASQCGADWDHSRHIGQLARRIHEQLAGAFDLPADDGVLLEAAGILQDVGYLINYDKHHKHSYHLISNSRLPGFHRQDLELVANIARYHRGATPKRKHEPFRRLSPAEQLRVRQCAAILRIAGGLDRSYSQQIRDVSVQVNNGRTQIVVQSAGDAEVDVWAARRRADLFEKVFSTQVVIRVTRP